MRALWVRACGRGPSWKGLAFLYGSRDSTGVLRDPSLAGRLGLLGRGDFTAGLVTKRASVIGVLLLVEGTGLAIVLAIVAITGEALPSGEAILLPLAAGIVGVSALGLFYSALAMGTMSIVAPISASGAALPVIVGLASGDTLSGSPRPGSR